MFWEKVEKVLHVRTIIAVNLRWWWLHTAVILKALEIVAGHQLNVHWQKYVVMKAYLRGMLYIKVRSVLHPVLTGLFWRLRKDWKYCVCWEKRNWVGKWLQSSEHCAEKMGMNLSLSIWNRTRNNLLLFQQEELG